MPVRRHLLRLGAIVIVAACAASCSVTGDSYDAEELRLLGSVRVDHAIVGPAKAGIGGVSADVTFARDFDAANDLHWPQDVIPRGNYQTASRLSDKAPNAEAFDAQAPGAPDVPSKKCLLTLYIPQHVDGRLFEEDRGELSVTCHI